ncbi:unnamed protein product [Closterium sp. NIES-53]
MAGMGDGYVGTAADAVRIRRLEKQREEEQAKMEELRKKSSQGLQGLLQFGTATSEVRPPRAPLPLQCARSCALRSAHVPPATIPRPSPPIRDGPGRERGALADGTAWVGSYAHHVGARPRACPRRVTSPQRPQRLPSACVSLAKFLAPDLTSPSPPLSPSAPLSLPLSLSSPSLPPPLPPPRPPVPLSPRPLPPQTLETAFKKQTVGLVTREQFVEKVRRGGEHGGHGGHGGQEGSTQGA